MRLRHPLLLLTVLSVAPLARAAEVPHGGWTTGYHRTVQIYSVWSYTVIRIDDSPGCGNSGDGDWLLPIKMTDPNQDKALSVKKTLLMMAMASGKTVRLRCENSRISDLIVAD